jgi:hypothetical protein
VSSDRKVQQNFPRYHFAEVFEPGLTAVCRLCITKSIQPGHSLREVLKFTAVKQYNDKVI